MAGRGDPRLPAASEVAKRRASQLEPRAGLGLSASADRLHSLHQLRLEGRHRFPCVHSTERGPLRLAPGWASVLLWPTGH